MSSKDTNELKYETGRRYRALDGLIYDTLTKEYVGDLIYTLNTLDSMLNVVNEELREAKSKAVQEALPL
jgi:hypothetical protein